MFTGIIVDIGTIQKIEKLPELHRLTIHCTLDLNQVAIGDSIAINGVCQTLVAKNKTNFTVEAVRETLNITTLGNFESGTPVNLELAMRLQDRLGGHLVSGHVDGLASIKSIQRLGSSFIFEFSLSPNLARFIVKKGSVAVDGISLTVATSGKDFFSVAVIPHTVEHTILKWKKSGDRVNIETDLIGKYIFQYLEQQQESNQKESHISRDFLSKYGFM